LGDDVAATASVGTVELNQSLEDRSTYRTIPEVSTAFGPVVGYQEYSIVKTSPGIKKFNGRSGTGKNGVTRGESEKVIVTGAALKTCSRTVIV
jgi:hypothetical protein